MEEDLIKEGNDVHPYPKVFSRLPNGQSQVPIWPAQISSSGSVTNRLISLGNNWRCLDRSELYHWLRFSDLYHILHFISDLIRTFCNYNSTFSNLQGFFFPYKAVQHSSFSPFMLIYVGEIMIVLHKC